MDQNTLIPPAETAPTEQPHRGKFAAWMHAHPYSTAIAGTIIILALGAFLLLPNRAVRPEGNVGTWGGGGVFFLGSSNPLDQGDPKRPSLETNISGADGPFVPIPIYSADPTADAPDFDITTLLEQLMAPAQSGQAPAPTDEPAGYAFIPQGSVSISGGIGVTPNLTPDQQAIHDYGNEAGAAIQSFENAHSDAAAVLSRHIAARDNAGAVAALKALAADMEAFSETLSALKDVPSSAVAAHASYAAAYATAGARLAAVAAASSDEAFLAAINDYNASVEQLSKRFQAVAGLFAMHGITFSSSEPGSVFMFSGSASLQ